jgi:hypothetical protein
MMFARSTDDIMNPPALTCLVVDVVCEGDDVLPVLELHVDDGPLSPATVGLALHTIGEERRSHLAHVPVSQ